MYWLRGFFQARKSFVTFGLVILLSLGLMVLNTEKKVALAQLVSFSTMRVGHWVFDWLVDLFNVRDENRFLREQNLRLSLELVKLRGERLENVRLRGLVGLKSRLSYPYISAEVIAREPGRHPNSLLIDVGTNEGVKYQMAVMSADGLVGKVLAVHPTSSVVQLLQDRNCRVSAVIQRSSRAQGIVRYEEGKLYLYGIPLRTDIQVGDLVVSSGMGGVFPADLPIGTVSELGDGQLGLFRDVILEPCVEFSTLEEVFVLKSGSDASSRQWNP